MNIKNFNEFIKNTQYHGSDYKFDSFQKYQSKGPSALGIFVTDDKDLANMFGENIYKVKVSIKNPYYITMDKQDDIRGKHAKDTSYFIKMRNDLIDKGYDSLFVKERFTKISHWDVRDPNIIAVFNIEDVEIL